MCDFTYLQVGFAALVGLYRQALILLSLKSIHLAIYIIYQNLRRRSLGGVPPFTIPCFFAFNYHVDQIHIYINMMVNKNHGYI